MRISRIWRGSQGGAARSSLPVQRPDFVISESDVALAYRILLGRGAENPEVVRQKTSLALWDLVGVFLESSEFRERIVDRVIGRSGAPAWAGPLRDQDGDAFVRAIGVNPDTLRAATHWAEFLGAVVDAAPIRDALAGALGNDVAHAFGDAVDEVRGLLFRTRAGLEQTLAALRERAHGLEIVSSSDILWEPATGLFHFVSDDPSIEMLVRADGLGGAVAARLSVEVARTDGSRSGTCIYVDDGTGFLESRKLALHPDPNETCHFILVAPSTISRLRLDFADERGSARIPVLSLEPLGQLDDLLSMVDPAARPDEAAIRSRILRSRWQRAAGREGLEAGEAAASSRVMTEVLAGTPVEQAIDYGSWNELYRTPEPDEYRRMAEIAQRFVHKPRFSFVVPTYNTELRFLRVCMESLLAQTYPDFEICVADDNSTNRAVGEYLSELADRDSRVKFRQRRTNGHISEASNTAASQATGDFLVLVDHDDAIPDYALFVVASYIQRHPNASIFFSDEDKITADGTRFEPYFKSEFNEFLMFGHNMVSHLGVYRTDLFRQVGGFRRTFEGSQDYDLFLRCYEAAGPASVVHIPHVLYHWRAIPGSTAVSADQKGYAIVAAQGALNGYFERSKLPFRSVDGFAPGITALDVTATSDARVSVIIATRDGLDVLRPCLDSILALRDDALEIIVVDNGSSDPDALAFLAGLSESGEARILRHAVPFNFSEVNNFGARHATGEILCFLNNDTEVVSRGWLGRARILLSRPEIGAVGARLLFPDGTVQHAGIVLGLGSHRVAGHPHAGWPASASGYFTKARLIAEVSAVTGACLFVRRAEFEAVGGFDTGLRVAYNDVDLCLKLRARGLKVIYDPDITLIHKESHSRGSDASGPQADRLELEADLMRTRWGDLLMEDPYYSPNLSLDSGNFLLACPPRVRLPLDEPA